MEQNLLSINEANFFLEKIVAGRGERFHIIKFW